MRNPCKECIIVTMCDDPCKPYENYVVKTISDYGYVLKNGYRVALCIKKFPPKHLELNVSVNVPGFKIVVHQDKIGGIINVIKKRDYL